VLLPFRELATRFKGYHRQLPTVEETTLWQPTNAGSARELFGRETEFDYAENRIGYAILALRVTMGWVLLQGGVTKLITYLDADPRPTGRRRATWPTPSRRATPWATSGWRWPATR